MRTPEKDLGLFYFENQARRARTTGWNPGAAYRFTWYNPQTGEWSGPTSLTADAQGIIQLLLFPGGQETAAMDWAAKMAGRRAGE